jgi:hypothetical protein
MVRVVEVRRRRDTAEDGGPPPREVFGVPYRAESHPPDVEEELARERARARLALYAHASAYLLVMILLVLVNLIQSPQRLWFVWPLVGWGAALVAHAIGVLALGRGGPAERYLVDRDLRRST